MKNLLLAFVCALALFGSAQAQTFVAYQNTSQAAPKNGLAVVAVPGDARLYVPGDPDYLEAGFPINSLLDQEVWIGNNQDPDPDASPATGARAKIFYQFYNSASNETVFYIAVPESGFTANNPYVRVMNNNGGSYSEFYEFQVALGTGGTLVTRPFFLTDDNGAVVGFTRSLGRFNAFKATGTTSLSVSQFPSYSTQTPLQTVLMHGIPSGASDMYIEISATGKSTSTLSGSSLRLERLPGWDNVTAVSFELPMQFRPINGNSAFTVNLRSKKGSTGTWSPTVTYTSN